MYVDTMSIADFAITAFYGTVALQDQVYIFNCMHYTGKNNF